MNMSSMTQNLSVVDFNDDKMSVEIGRINSTLSKFNHLIGKAKGSLNSVNRESTEK